MFLLRFKKELPYAPAILLLIYTQKNWKQKFKEIICTPIFNG
jgi:hypothetical protein